MVEDIQVCLYYGKDEEKRSPFKSSALLGRRTSLITIFEGRVRRTYYENTHTYKL